MTKIIFNKDATNIVLTVDELNNTYSNIPTKTSSTSVNLEVWNGRINPIGALVQEMREAFYDTNQAH